MSESEPQVPLTAQFQEWLNKGTRLITIAALTAEIAALRNDADKDAEEPETQKANDRAAVALREAVGHLDLRPQEQEAKDAARLDWLLSNDDCHVSAYRWQPTLGIQATRYNVYRNGRSLGFGDSPRAAIDAAIAAQAAQGKTA